LPVWVCNVKVTLMILIRIEKLQRLSLIYVGKNLDSILIPCYQLNLTERSFSERMAQNAILSLGHNASLSFVVTRLYNE
jgi:hypothetical protein